MWRGAGRCLTSFRGVFWVDAGADSAGSLMLGGVATGAWSRSNVMSVIVAILRSVYTCICTYMCVCFGREEGMAQDRVFREGGIGSLPSFEGAMLINFGSRSRVDRWVECVPANHTLQSKYVGRRGRFSGSVAQRYIYQQPCVIRFLINKDTFVAPKEFCASYIS